MCVLAVACSPPAGPPLTISNVVVFEPLPGTNMTAGYLTLANNSNQPIAIDKVTSPQFARVEMHETVIQDDVARMVALAPLIIERHSSVQFEPGGKHLMMFDSTKEIMRGMPVTVEFHYDTSGLLIVATTVSSRDELLD
jgi:copper(I)-binding protein